MNGRVVEDNQREIFLHPGDFHFSGDGQVLGTLLGSCIAVCLWHPILKLGGMCHFVLPSQPARSSSSLNGRYAVDAMEMFRISSATYNTHLNQYKASIYGGANVVSCLVKGDEDTIGERNAAAALELLMANNVPVGIVDVGETWPRRISFDPVSGEVTVNAKN